MVAIVVIFCTVALSVLAWFLIQSSPRILSMVLPRRLTYTVGVVLLVLALFSAYAAASVLRSPYDVLASFTQGYVGLWFILAPSAASRGTESDDRMLRRLFTMMGVVLGAIIASLFVRNPQLLALLNLSLVTAGFWLTTNFLHDLDRDRRR